MKGGMKKAFTALLAATVLVGGMPVNMQANVIAETEKAESASEKVNEKYADTEELDLMDRERQETQAGEQEKRENTEQPESEETEQPDTEEQSEETEQPDTEEQPEETEQPDTETEQKETELSEMEEETEEREETSIKGDASEEQIAAEQKAWTLINKYADPDYFLTDPERNAITDAQFEELRQAALQAVAGCTTQYEKIKAIMAFVADRTYYDYYAYYNNKPSYWSPYEVYEQKRAMCSGYASLMRTLCISIGIPCMDLEGHAHEYNAVYDSENGKWIFADATWCSRNSYSVDKEWEYQGYSDGYFDLSPEEIAELSNHQIYRVDGLLKDGLYYSLISYRWSRGNWYFDLAAVKNKNIRQVKCGGFEDIDVLEVNDGAGVFADCTLLEEADLSQTGITELEGTFEGCSALETVKLPENITKIGFGTFTGCSSLEKMDLSQTLVTEIGGSAFSACSGLKTVKFPKTLTAIDSYAFLSCKNLTGELDLSQTAVKTIGICAFYKDGGVLGKIRLPKTTTEIGSEAFSWETTDGPEKIYVITSLSKDKINAEALKRNVPVVVCPYLYQIKFDGNGAAKGKMSEKACAAGQKEKLSKNKFEKKGYTFAGWNTQPDGKGTFYEENAYVKNLTKKADEVVTLYAQWKAAQYQITYNLNGGKNNKKNPKTYKITSKTIKLSNPSKKGYVFKGWYCDKKCTKKVTSIKKGSTGKVTLYAKWAKEKYTITYKLNGGKNNKKNPKTYTITSKMIKLAAPTRKGYVFKGWYRDKKCTRKVTSIKKGSTGKITLYAKWKKK